MEVGQIINSINNIFNICKIQYAKRIRKLDKPDVRINEESKNLVEQLIPRLQVAHQVVDELVQVYNQYGKDYDREKAYAEEIDTAQREAAEKQKLALANRAAKEFEKLREIVGESTGNKTGKAGATSQLGEKTQNIR
jgi:hypothetical protein